MGKINAINNQSEELTIDPGASGDSFIQFDINATGEFRIGVDDTDSDMFKISQGSALGTNDTFKMTANGERTMPLQPAFSAIIQTSNINNITGDGTVYTVVWQAERFDQGADFDGTSTFTAPITGKYHFIAALQPTGIVAAHNTGYIEIVSTGDTYRGDIKEVSNAMFTNTLALRFDAIIPMTASDTAVVRLYVDGSTKVVDIQSSDVNNFTCCLIC